MMKILVLSDRYPPLAEGGYELNCRALMTGLAARGHDIRVLTSSFGLPAPEVQGSVLRLMSAPQFPDTGLARRTGQYAFFRAGRENAALARQAAADFRPDLVYVAQMSTPSVLPVLALQAAGYPILWRIESFWLLHLHDRLVGEKNVLKRAYQSLLLSLHRFEELDFRRAVVIGNCLLEDHRRAGFDVSGWSVLPSPVDHAWFSRQAFTPAPAAGEPWRLLFCGRYTELKGVDVAIEAVARLKAEGHDVRLDCVGQGDARYTGQLRDLVAAREVGDVVSFLPFRPRSELPALYDAHHILLFPTRAREGLGMVMVEALARGLPVVGSDIGGPRDVIKPGVTGLLVPSGDAPAMARAVGQIIGEPGRFETMARAGMADIREQYAYEHLLDSYERLIEDAARQGKPS